MHTRRVGYVLLGVLALVVLSLAGSTLTTTVDAPGGETGVDVPEDDPATGFDITPPAFDFVMYLLFGTFVLLLLAGIYGLLRQPIDTIRRLFQTVGAGVVVVGMILFALFLMEDGSEPMDVPEQQPANESTGDEGTGSGAEEGVGSGAESAIERLTESPELLLLGGLIILTLGVIAAALMSSEPNQSDGSFETEPDDHDTLSAIGAVAGEAADRLEASASVENEVFRAWKRMTGLLDVEDPDVLTPGEFRRAAVEAGMAADDVAELTRLFEDVRYGDQSVTAEHEQRAVEALRRIQNAYAAERTSSVATLDGGDQ